MSDNASPTMVPETKSFSGGYLLYRKVAGGLKRPGFRSQVREPRFRHPSFAAAEGEAARLLEQHPDSTFIILHEVARVKLKEGGPVATEEPQRPVDGDPAEIFEAHARWAVQMELANG